MVRPLIPRGVPFTPTEASLAESERLARSVMAGDGDVLDGAPKIGSSMLVVMPEVHLGLVLRVRELEAELRAAAPDEARRCLEAAFIYWLSSSANRTYGATQAEWRDRIAKVLGPERVAVCMDSAGVHGAPIGNGRHG